MPWTIKTEFPDYDPATLPAIPEGWVDSSYCNDVCPSWTTADRLWQIWIDYADPSEREFTDARRYTAKPLDSDGCIINDYVCGEHTDDWSVILRAITR
jgi:hypothetical protein